MRAIAVWMALLPFAACGTMPAATPDAAFKGSPATGRDTCASFGFRESTPASVVCPGASSCLCTGSDACCLQAVDSSRGVCEPVGRCRTFVLQCDGPEDCAESGGVDAGTSDGGAPDMAHASRICCLDESVGVSGGGTSWRALASCTGKVLCRSDDDCAIVPGLPRCRPADYGTPGVEDRGLDGLVGNCTR